MKPRVSHRIHVATHAPRLANTTGRQLSSYSAVRRSSNACTGSKKRRRGLIQQASVKVRGKGAEEGVFQKSSE